MTPAPPDPDKRARLLLESAAGMVHGLPARAIVVAAEALPPLAALPDETILLVRDGLPAGLPAVGDDEAGDDHADDAPTAARLARSARAVVHVPPVRLSRLGQARLAAMMAMSAGALSLGDEAVFLVGPHRRPIDALFVLQLGEEYRLAEDGPGRHGEAGEDVGRAVFLRMLSLALMLGQTGREGRPVGTILVIGDSEAVLERSEQLVLNPFRGYPEHERSVLDSRITETIREYSALDGAFVIRADGVVEAAGAHLRASLADKLPSGLGSRHAAAAGITAVTDAIAITVSESGGVVRVWRRGRMVAVFDPGQT